MAFCFVSCSKEGGEKWNSGKTLPISSLVSELSTTDLLKELKSECGGLQTLLKNHRYIFVVSKGTVRLRIPDDDMGKPKFKTKICWFYENHPQGCPSKMEDCCWAHGKQDLKIDDNLQRKKIKLG